MSTVPPTTMAPADAVSDIDAAYDAQEPFEEEAPVVPPTIDECSTNFYYKIPGTHHTFIAQFTVRGAPSKEKLKMHLRAAMESMGLVVDIGGVPRESQLPTLQTPAPATPASTPGAMPAT